MDLTFRTHTGKTTKRLLHATSARGARFVCYAALLTLVLFLATAASPPRQDGPQIYYLSTAGDDENEGAFDTPFRTFAHAVGQLGPGDELRVYPGTYAERVRVEAQGTPDAPITIRTVEGSVVVEHHDTPLRVTGAHLVLEDFEITGSADYCADIGGQNVVVRRFFVHNCHDHGILVRGQQVRVENSTITNTVLENQNQQATGGWGSGLKLMVGAEDVVLTGNTVYENWGEGIAATRARNVQIVQNRLYDNFSVNLYIDNSTNVVAERNFITCTEGSPFARPDKPASGIAFGEEAYEDWGAQLSHVSVLNNIVAYCGLGIANYHSEVGGGLQHAIIAHNTLWGGKATALSMLHDPALTDVLIANNIVQQPEGRVAWLEDPSGFTLTHNFWVGAKPRSWRAIGSESDRWGDVQFETAPGDTPETFRLSANSRAIDAALPIAGTAHDFEGNPRQTDENPLPDMGAIEAPVTQPAVAQTPSLICRVLAFLPLCRTSSGAGLAPAAADLPSLFGR